MINTEIKNKTNHSCQFFKPFWHIIFLFLSLEILGILPIQADIIKANVADCYKIDKLEIEDSYQLSQRQIKGLKKKYETRCLNIEDIKEILKIITNIVISDGYITSRAYTPEQNLKDRKLVIKIQEGMIEDIEHTSDSHIKNNCLPIRKGQILNLRDIEQGVDNLTRLKSNNINIYLKPGETQGGSIVVIENKPSKKWHINTGADNSGSKNRGRNQSFTNLGVEDLLGLSEHYSLGYRTSLGNAQNNFMRSYSTSFSLPFGYNNFSLYYNSANYRTFIETPRNKYTNKGGSKVAKINIDRIVHRDGNSKTNIATSIGSDNYSNYIADNKIEMATYRIHKFDLKIGHQRRLESSAISFNLIYTGGENQNYSAKLTKLSTPPKRFGKINYNIIWHKPLPVFIDKKNIKYQLQLSGQYSPDMLVVTEKDTVGGLSSVRGFQDYSENADNTIIIRNELIADLPSFQYKKATSLIGDMSIFGAFDFAKFSTYEEKGKRTGVMSGAAIGVRNTNGYMNFSVTIAKPLEAAVPIKRSTVVYTSLAIDL